MSHITSTSPPPPAAAGHDETSGKVMIKTPRLILRGARRTNSDVDGLHTGFSDPEVMAYWSNPAYTSREQTENWVAKMADSPRNGVTDFVICERKQPQQPPAEGESGGSVEVVKVSRSGEDAEEGEVEEEEEEEGAIIGKIGVWSGNEIGFLLAQTHWGKGLASEALTAVLNYLFSELPTIPAKEGNEAKSESEDSLSWDWIMADIDPRNLASLGILKKFGFWQYDYKVASAQYGDQWVDSMYLKLTREEWLQKRRKVVKKAV